MRGLRTRTAVVLEDMVLVSRRLDDLKKVLVLVSSRKSWAGLGVSNIDVDIDDTFVVSISTILLSRSIESSIDDTFTAVFADTSISILADFI
jgi:hypothetical protein